MSFWKRKQTKQQTPPADTGQVQPAKKVTRRSPPVPLEVKLLALEALQTGLTIKEVAGIIGVSGVTLSNWRKQYNDKGLGGLYRRTGSKAVRKACTQLEQRILAHRTEHPEHGVRRFRDELRREAVTGAGGSSEAVGGEPVRPVGGTGLPCA